MAGISEFKPVKVFVPVGSLGAGINPDEVEAAIAKGMDCMAMDAGSTDSGAAYLAKGMSKNNRGAVKTDLQYLLDAWAKTKAPVIIGTAGQAGGDMNVDWTVDIVREIAKERGYTPKIAVLYSEQSAETLKAKNAVGKIKPLPPLGPLDDKTIDECLHIVALMGPEPFVAALEAGADIIIGGRSTDTAVLACYPIWKGAGLAAAWHAGKTGECGAQATVNTGGSRGVFLRVDRDSFDVEPVMESRGHCSPYSVSAHMLYENSNPFRLIEPGGVLDVTNAHYEQISEAVVRVTGSVWEPKPYSMKLEGASGQTYQTIMFIGIADPLVLANLDTFHDKMHARLTQRVKHTIGEAAGVFDISLRIYGWNAVDGQPVPEGTSPPREVGVMCVITAETQDLANQMAKACNPMFFHMPVFDGLDMPSYGFPFTPADIPRGQVFEFRLNHVVELDDPLELVRTEWVDLSVSEKKEPALA